MNWMVHKSNISPVYHSNKLALLSSKKIAGTKRVYHKKTVMGIIFTEVRGTWVASRERHRRRIHCPWKFHQQVLSFGPFWPDDGLHTTHWKVQAEEAQR
jgi:hypothetical protein